jgi:uncharacterized protein YlxW (UPF0749 family)
MNWSKKQFMDCSSYVHFCFVYSRQSLLERIQMRKQIKAALAAFLITGILALSMFVVGVNALVNSNGTTAANSSTQATALNTSVASSADQAQIAQLQSLVSQYQARELQYQAALQSDNAQLSQAASETQMIQQLLTYLQNRGLIQIDSQGNITITGR